MWPTSRRRSRVSPTDTWAGSTRDHGAPGRPRGVAESGAGCTDRSIDQPPGTGVFAGFCIGPGPAKSLMWTGLAPDARRPSLCAAERVAIETGEWVAPDVRLSQSAAALPGPATGASAPGCGGASRRARDAGVELGKPGNGQRGSCPGDAANRDRPWARPPELVWSRGRRASPLRLFTTRRRSGLPFGSMGVADWPQRPRFETFAPRTSPNHQLSCNPKSRRHSVGFSVHAARVLR